MSIKLPLLFLLLLISFSLHAQQDHYLNSKSTRAEYSDSQLPAPEIQQSGQRYTLKWNNLGAYLTAYPSQTQDDYSFGSSNQPDPQKEAEKELLQLIQQQSLYPQLQQINQQQSDPLPENQLKRLYRQLKGELPAPRIIRSQTGSEGFLFAAVPTLSVDIEWTIPQQQLLTPLQQAIANSEVVQQRRIAQAKAERKRRLKAKQKRALEAKRQAAAAKKREAERQARLAKEKRQRREAEQRRLKALEEMDEIIIGDNKSTIDQAAVTALLAKSSPQWAARFSRTLEIDANLSPATVTVDGKGYGEQTLPYRIQLPLGVHRVELSGSGYRTATEEYTFNVGGAVSVEQIWLTLNKEPVAYTLQGEHLNGSTIKVNGSRHSGDYRGEELELNWGKSYQLEVVQKGYKPYQERITVYRPGKGSNQHRVKLVKQIPAQPTGFNMVELGKAGQQQCYRMGSPSNEKGRGDDERQHRVCIDSFRIASHEVSNAMYRKYQRSHNSKEFKGHSLNGAQQPVVWVSWDEVNDYIDWLNRTQKPAKSYRLPTEAEWEYAARGGESSRYYWGEDRSETRACDYANVKTAKSTRTFDWFWDSFNCEDNHLVSAPVGSYRPNNYGLYDILGNVWEWTASDYDKSYSGGELRSSTQGRDSVRVMRGGSWFNIPGSARVSSRGMVRTNVRSFDLGFRLAQDL